MKPGETDTNKKTVYFKIFDIDGLPASGKTDEGAVFTPIAGELQYNRDLAGYTNATLGNFAHVSDGDYKYTFADAEITGTTEGTVLLRVKRDPPTANPIRTQTVPVPLLYNNLERWLGATPAALSSGLVQCNAPTAASIRDAILDELLSGHSVVGSVADGIAIAAGLLQGNFMMDDVNNSNPDGQTAARIRIWRTAAAMAAATVGGSGLQGAFAQFDVVTAYVGPNKIQSHTVTRTT